MKFFLIIITLSCFALLDSFAQDRTSHLDPAGVIEVQKSVTIGDLKGDIKVVRLSHIARFSGFPQPALNELSDLAVMDAPKRGESVRKTSQEISGMFREVIQRVQAQYGLRILFKIPAEIIVTYGPLLFNEQNVKRNILEQMRNQCADCVHEVANLSLPLVPAAIANLDWTLHFPGDSVRGTFSLPVTFAGDTGRRTFWISGQALRRQLVPVAKRKIDIGQRIQKGDFEISLRDVTFAADGVPTEEMLVDQKARQGIAYNEIIWKNSLLRKRALSFGERAQVIVGQEGWQVSTFALAQENADIGDSVKLLNPKTRKVISGVVVGERLVRIR